MHAPSKSSGPSAFQAFVPIARRGIPFITMGAQTLGCHTFVGVRMIDPFASQNLPPSPQPQAEKGLTYARVIHSTLGFCVTTPPAPAAFLGSLKLPGVRHGSGSLRTPIRAPGGRPLGREGLRPQRLLANVYPSLTLGARIGVSPTLGFSRLAGTWAPVFHFQVAQPKSLIVPHPASDSAILVIYDT